MNTSSRNSTAVHPVRMSRLAPALACLFTVLGLPVHAAVSFPDVPMQTNNGVPPNIWFILDDSGSMARNFMPDDVADTAPTRIETQTYTRNSIYYNPSTTYRGWQRADGSFMPDTPYTAVYNDDSFVGGGTTTLGGAVQTFYIPQATITNLADSTQYTRYRFLTDGTATKCDWRTTPTVGYDNCTNNVTNFPWPGGVTRNLAQEKQNFANWFSYHQTRVKVAKAGASYAFNDPGVFNADNDYRVGYTTIWNNQTFRIPVGTNNGLFTGANRDTWFARLFATDTGGFTPLIPALTRAGQYFEETGAGGPWGPQVGDAQFECRQNFTILTTDGFWNNTAGALTPGNSDNTAGALITGPDVGNGPQSYQYTPADSFRDGWSNTLADVAMHYWKNDLRDLQNTVPTSASNPAFWQHMVTFGISIGLSGTLDVTATNALINNRDATTNLPAPLPVAWPDPMDAENPERIDDLYHAAVNGHGSFVSAGNPAQFSEGLGNALRAISARKGSGSNATVSGTSTSAGNKVFQAKYFASKWYGELLAYNVTATGVDTTTPLWTASIPAFATRKIFTSSGSSGATFPTAAQSTALTADVADYIRGDRSNEPQVTAGGTMRTRTSLLGSIVNSSPIFVKSSTGVDTVYVGANDGMMHAFDATTGAERFAYVPRGLDFSELKSFSDPDYSHRFFVDGPIITSTERELTSRTILVGTLGRGGKGLYALDVTDPVGFNASKVLWDKNGGSDDDMGQILTKPLIAKLNDGSTALIVPNGLNSNNERAVLFVFDLETGAEIERIDVGGANNGLSAPRGWDEDSNGTVDFVYAGDFEGNLWKFNLSDNNSNNWAVADGRPLYQTTAAGTQPITGGVTIAVDPATDKRWVFFGTGRMLTSSDLTNTSRQTWYGVIDADASTSSAARANMTARNIPFFDSGTKSRAFEANSALPANSRGWYVDLDLPPSNTLEGERMVGDQQIVKNALIAASIIPLADENPCRPGRGYINAIDAFTGTSLVEGLFDANRNGQFGDIGDKLGGGNAIGSIDLGVGMVTDPALLDKLLIAGGSLATLGSTPLDPALYGGRISWREITGR